MNTGYDRARPAPLDAAAERACPTAGSATGASPHSPAVPPLKLAEAYHTGAPGLDASGSPLLAPLIAASVGAAAEAGPEGAPDLVQLLVPALTQRLRELVTPAFLLELNVHRVEGQLDGDTPELRYAEFRDGYRDPAAAMVFFRRYPILAELVTTVAGNWSAAAAELCWRLAGDRAELVRRLGGGRGDPGRVCKVGADAGDSHNGGRGVAILTFESGLRVVYKPRPLAMEARFQQLLRWLCVRAPGIALRGYQVLDRGEYGWAEFVAQRPIATVAGARRYYRRTGFLLAVMYCLRADDLHHENIVAAGDQPVVVDLESLFAPTLRTAPDSGPEDFWTRAGPTVLSTGLLPISLFGGPDRPGVDISGLGGAAGQTGGRTWPVVVEPETDRANIQWRTPTTTASNNQLLMNGVPIRASEFADEIVEGFRAAITVIRANADALCAPGGVLAGFTDAPARLILRPTMQYSLLAQMLIHPDHLYDAAGPAAVLAMLRSAPATRNVPADLVDSEITDLTRGDVPYFRVLPGDTGLGLGNGTWRSDMLAAAPLDEVRDRINDLTDAGTDREVWVIRAALRVPELNAGEYQFPVHPLSESRPIDADDLLAGARRIADRLLDLAVPVDSELRWLTVSSVAGRSWAVRDADNDLYDGCAGIALFLHYIAAATANPDYLAAARSATATATHDAEQHVHRTGGFVGLGSLIYLLTHAGALTGDAKALQTAHRLATHAGRLIPQDTRHDVLTGNAGLILCLLGLHRIAPDAELVALARAAGDHLVQAAVPCAGGRSWPLETGNALTGLAHGSAGIAMSLAALAQVSADRSYREGALAAVGHERHWFSQHLDNWPDLRDLPELHHLANPADGLRYLTTWCHGAPGIGLTRCAMVADAITDRAMHEEIRAAAKTTLHLGFGSSHSLCHGDLGNLEALAAAARVLRDADLDRAVARRRAAVFASVLESPVCGTPFGLEVPGLMMGLAGIGYGLLRGARPAATPDVLRLAAPHRSRTGG